jgi:hypothetical protein
VTGSQAAQDATGECFTQSADTTSPAISVQVCVNPDGSISQSVPATGSAAADQSGVVQPGSGTTSSAGTSGPEATTSGDTLTAQGGFVVNQGTVSVSGSAGAAATCVSISVTNGQPTIVSPAAPDATLQPAPTTPQTGGGAPTTGQGAPTNGQGVPAQPGAGSGTQTSPNTIPQPGQ